MAETNYFPSSSPHNSPQPMRVTRKQPIRTYGRARPPNSPGPSDADKSSTTLVDLDFSPAKNTKGKKFLLDQLPESISSQETRIDSTERDDDGNNRDQNGRGNYFAQSSTLASPGTRERSPSVDSEVERELEKRGGWKKQLEAIDKHFDDDPDSSLIQDEPITPDISMELPPPSTPESGQESPLPAALRQKTRPKQLLDLGSDSEPSASGSKGAALSGDAASMSEVDAKGKRKRVTKTSKGKQRAKPKGLTKKEQDELKREQARLLANQRVERKEAPTRMRPVSDLAGVFEIKSSKSQSDLRRHESSDPIMGFSSPADKSAPFRISPRRNLLTTKVTKPITPPRAEKMDIATLSDDSDDLPNLADTIRQSEEKHQAEQKQKQLRAQKMKILQHQASYRPIAPEDDDDLEVMDVKKTKPPQLLERRKLPAIVARPKKGGGGAKDQLAASLLQRAEQQKADGIRKKEEDFERRGGKVLPGVLPDGSHEIQSWVTKLSKAGVEADGNEGDEEDSDEDWKPGEAGSPQGSPPGDENEGLVPTQVGGSDTETDENEHPHYVPRRGRKSNIVDSDDEGVKILAPDTSVIIPQPHEPSPLDETMENGTDKENNMELMFDMSEDKENTLFRPPAPSASDRARSLTLSPVRFEGRMPFGELGAEASGSRGRKDSSGSEGSPLLQPMFGGGGSDEDNDSPKPINGDGFSQLFGSGTAAQGRTLRFGSPSQRSTQKQGGLDTLRRSDPEEFSLTLDVGFQPALNVSDTQLQKADSIFEKEQDYILEAANVAKAKIKPQLYIDENGFLTQTRPDSTNPELYRPPPTPATQIQTERKPLGTIAVSEAHFSSDEDEEEDIVGSGGRGKRLRRYDSVSPIRGRTQDSRANTSPSPTPNRKPKDAFDVMRLAAAKKEKQKDKQKEKKPLGQSVYIQGEAQESDEDDGYGFGGATKPGEDDEDDDEAENDKPLEGLVNDEVMDAEVVAEEKVVEKFKEQAELDDQVLEKYHQDAIEGKFRTKRSRRGVDLSDSDTDDETRAANRNVRPKKRRVDGDTLDELAKNEDTLPFVQAYHHGLEDEPIFALAEEDVVMTNGNDEGQEAGEDDDDDDDENAPLQPITANEIREQVRRIAQEEEPVETFDPSNTSWLDDGDEDEGETEVRLATRKSTRPGPSADPDNMRYKKPTEEKEAARLHSWAKQNGRSGISAAYAPTGGSVTARPKVALTKQKAGVPSRLDQRKSRSSGGSMLSVVSSKRKGFEN